MREINKEGIRRDTIENFIRMAREAQAESQETAICWQDSARASERRSAAVCEYQMTVEAEIAEALEALLNR